MIEEQFENCETKEDKLAYIDGVTTLETLKDTCEEAFEMHLQLVKGYNPFMHALMNTIDWQELLVDVSNDMEVEKKALDNSDSDEE